MARAAQSLPSPTPEPAIVGMIRALPVDAIDVAKDRIRPLNRVWAEGLAQIIARDGHKDPIRVWPQPGGKRWTLVAGLHRLEAHKINGSPTIHALEDDSSTAERRKAEITENLFRSGLDPIDRAAHVAELYELERALAGVDQEASAQM